MQNDWNNIEPTGNEGDLFDILTKKLKEWLTQELEERLKVLTAELYDANSKADDKSAEEKQSAEDLGHIQLKIQRTKNMAADYLKRARKNKKSTAKMVEEVGNFFKTSKILGSLMGSP